MSSIAEQISATSKSQLESQLNFLNSVLKKTFDSAGQVLALNISTARNVAERGTAAARQLIDAKDPRAALDLARPFSALEGLSSYGRELFSIAATTHAELLQTARDQFRTEAATGAAAGLLPKLPSLPTFPQAAAAGRDVIDSAAAATQEATAQMAAAARQATEAVAAATIDAASQAARSTTAAAQAMSDTSAQASDAVADATAEAAHKTLDAADTAAQAGSQAVDAASQAVADVANVSDVANAAGSAQAVTGTVVEQAAGTTEKTVEQIAAAVAESAPAAGSAALFDGEGAATTKNVRAKPASKPVAEAVAALADKPSTTLKNLPGKSRK
ncbi:phasin family protein [Pseudoduganella lurida]|uniref:Phasin family protein n=1 Tax=Pseudoduganella lurida TaxID=1036180 RepID=A0A562R5T9_9BURK|nr:TIGR01841 family phasin [Pseudoduganella lurida]TWI64435.1 phasin family protein [Pseudoduganella lurida]